MIGSILKWTAILVLAFLFQTTLVQTIAVAGVQPDLILVALFFLSIQGGSLTGIYVGFFLGLGQDLYSPSVLGQNALGKTIAGAFCGLFNEKVMRTDPLIRLVILVLVFFLHDAVFSIASAVKFEGSLSGVMPSLLTETLPRALYSVVIAAATYVWIYVVRPATAR